MLISQLETEFGVVFSNQEIRSSPPTPPSSDSLGRGSVQSPSSAGADSARFGPASESTWPSGAPSATWTRRRSGGRRSGGSGPGRAGLVRHPAVLSGGAGAVLACKEAVVQGILRGSRTPTSCRSHARLGALGLGGLDGIASPIWWRLPGRFRRLHPGSRGGLAERSRTPAPEGAGVWTSARRGGRSDLTRVRDTLHSSSHSVGAAKVRYYMPYPSRVGGTDLVGLSRIRLLRTFDQATVLPPSGPGNEPGAELLPGNHQGVRMRVLVTGGTGFTGTALVRRLGRRGTRSWRWTTRTGCSATPSGRWAPRSCSGSVTDRAVVDRSMRGVEFVFHLAAAFRELNVPNTFYDEVNVRAPGTCWRRRSRPGCGSSSTAAPAACTATWTIRRPTKTPRSSRPTTTSAPSTRPSRSSSSSAPAAWRPSSCVPPRSTAPATPSASS